MQIFYTKHVFTPTTEAKETFVERSSKINNLLVDALNTPGMQVIVYGHSGSGKTTLILNKLDQLYERKIITRCEEGMTFDTVLANAFDELNPYYISETTTVRGKKISPAITLSYKEIKTTISGFEVSDSKQAKLQRFIPPQLTVQRLATFLGEINCCWVLDDFHKIKTQEKKRMSQSLKIFKDSAYNYPDIKIIALGAVGTARQVIEYDLEMNNRVTEVNVPLMSESEIREIIIKGQKKLNLNFRKDVVDIIVKVSCGLPYICHQICLNICFNKNILKTYIPEVKNDHLVITMDDYYEAIEKYIEQKSDTFKSQYDKAVKTDSSKKLNKAKVVLKGIIDFRLDNFYIADLVKILNKSTFSFQHNEVEKILNEFTTADRSEILVYDSHSNTYSFNNVFLKAYCKLRFQSDDAKEIDIYSRERKIVRYLLQAVENDRKRDLSEVLDEENDFRLMDFFLESEEEIDDDSAKTKRKKK